MKIPWMKHQLEALHLAKSRIFTALFMETGTGKTPVALAALEFWLNELKAGRGIVFCPNTLTGNWVVEAEKWDCNLSVVRLEGDRKKRLAMIKDPYWDVLVVNYESARLLKEELMSVGAKAVVFDELQALKDRRALQTQACRAVAVGATYKLGLTGTPVIHSPLDLWSEFDVLDPQVTRNHPLGYGSYSAFEKGIATVIPHPRLGYRARIITFQDDKLQELKRRVASMAMEATKEDCLDLPERMFIPVPLTMTDKQTKIYRQLQNESVAYLDAIEAKSKIRKNPMIQKPDTAMMEDFFAALAAGGDVTEPGQDTAEVEGNRVSATLVVTLMSRLQQVTSGFAKTDDGVIHELESVKLNWLTEKLPAFTDTTGDHKVVIFCRFTHDVDALIALCTKMNIGHVYLDGRNSAHAVDVVQRFQNDKDVRVFIGQLQVSSKGITLTAADYCVFYSNSFAAGDRSQAEDRIFRKGQERHVTYYDLTCIGTIDGYILKNLREKNELAIKTVKDLKKVLLGEESVA